MKGTYKPTMAVGMAVVFLSLTLFSCSSEVLSDHTDVVVSDNICFGVSDSYVGTRAGVAGEAVTTDRFVLRSSETDDTLCVRAVVSDGIGNSVAAGPATRAAMQTGMYDAFKVVAAVKENGTGTQFFMNETASKNGTNWVPEHTYYWPVGRQLRFLAWAPVDAELKVSPVSPMDTTIKYTVPTDVAKQCDLVAAATGYMGNPGNNAVCTPVGLQFKHLCTAVKIVTGATMASGTIKSVKISKVRNSGTYDMVTSEWTLEDGTADYSIEPNLATTGTTPDGTALNDEDATFMLLPQTLGSDSQLEVVFHDNITNRDRTLTASLDGAEWPMGKTVTYRLSITPEYELNIDNVSEIVDAHYVIEPIKIRLSNLESNTKWTLTTKIDGEVYNGTDVSVQLENLEDGALNVAKQGFWIDKYVAIKRNDNGEIISKKLTNQSARGTATISGTGNIETDAYVFIPENIGNSDRNITITLKVDGTSDADAATKTIIQKCPSWNGSNVGYERFEENNGGNYPFGFSWDRKKTYVYDGFLGLLFKWIAQSYQTQESKKYVSIDWYISGFFVSKATVIIDYGQLNESLDVGMSTDNGLENTRKLYTFKGIGSISEMETTLDNIYVGKYTWHEKKEEGGDYQTVKNFAAKMAVMKNKFNVEKREQKDSDGNTVIFYVPDIDEKDILWYLPASNEQMGITDTEYPLSGTYWSSTAAQANKQAYVYSSGINAIETDRMATHKIRAARRK